MTAPGRLTDEQWERARGDTESGIVAEASRAWTAIRADRASLLAEVEHLHGLLRHGAHGAYGLPVDDACEVCRAIRAALEEPHA